MFGASKEMNKDELFARTPVKQALWTMAIPTIISQLINLIYNLVDTFFIGRTGNSYMMAATTIALILYLLNISIANLFGMGGGSLIARLMGEDKYSEIKSVSSFSVYCSAVFALLYSLLVWVFLEPLLFLLGASENTIGYASSYAIIVVVIGNLPCVLSMVLAHLMRNSGFATLSSVGLSLGGVLNVILDPIFMFVLLPKGHEVEGAAIATTLSNTISCLFLLGCYIHVRRQIPLSVLPKDATSINKKNLHDVFAVGIPSALLSGLYDLSNIFLSTLSAGHSDLILAGVGIVLKVERIPTAINIGICQGMVPIVAYNYSNKNNARMRETIKVARIAGFSVSALAIIFFEIFASPVSSVFLDAGASGATEAAVALETLGYAATFLRIRCLASPFQFMNFNSSLSLQAIGDGKHALIHTIIRQLVLYIPLMFLLNSLFGAVGLVAAFPLEEVLGGALGFYFVDKYVKIK